jgi:16S rRNA (uracil1498-N3)-methyltransferase
MKIHKFICQFDKENDSLKIDDKDIIFQINNVLKIKPGELIQLSNGNGYEVLLEIININKNSLEGKVIGEKTFEQKNKLFGFISILKKDNFELAIQKMVEIGVTEIFPILTDRTIKKGYDTKRILKIIKEATEQSDNKFLVILNKEVSLKEAIEKSKELSQVQIVFERDGCNKSETLSVKDKSVSFFIGPEGGWSTDEKDLFKKENINFISLGNTTLRGETAAVVGTFWIKERQ